MIKKEYREGDTDPVAITLMDGEDPADITGYASVSLFLRSKDKQEQVEKATGGNGITVVDADAGEITVTFEEDELAFAKSRYEGYFIVVDGSGNRSSFPNDEEIAFVMRERLSGDEPSS
jgi:hypothetical protein